MHPRISQIKVQFIWERSTLRPISGWMENVHTSSVGDGSPWVTDESHNLVNKIVYNYTLSFLLDLPSCKIPRSWNYPWLTIERELHLLQMKNERLKCTERKGMQSREYHSLPDVILWDMVPYFKRDRLQLSWHLLSPLSTTAWILWRHLHPTPIWQHQSTFSLRRHPTRKRKSTQHTDCDDGDWRRRRNS